LVDFLDFLALEPLELLEDFLALELLDFLALEAFELLERFTFRVRLRAPPF
jgi:hypothetical protein